MLAALAKIQAKTIPGLARVAAINGCGRGLPLSRVLLHFPG